MYAPLTTLRGQAGLLSEVIKAFHPAVYRIPRPSDVAIAQQERQAAGDGAAGRDPGF